MRPSCVRALLCIDMYVLSWASFSFGPQTEKKRLDQNVLSLCDWPPAPMPTCRDLLCRRYHQSKLLCLAHQKERIRLNRMFDRTPPNQPDGDRQGENVHISGAICLHYVNGLRFRQSQH